MDKIIDKIIKHKIVIITLFCFGLIFSILAAPMVNINYNLTDYLPQDSKSTISLNFMNEEFSSGTPNVRIMVEDVSIPQALEYKESISDIEGVKEINWLDDMVDVKQPLDIVDEEIVDSWYKDDNALFTVSIDTEDDTKRIISEMEEIVGDKGAFSGEAITLNYTQTTTSEETTKIMLFVLPIIIVILMISTSSWFEPFLFLFTVGVAIVINMGTNIFLGEVSFVTQSSSAILQLAVSMDYSIFLLHRFAEFREGGMDVKDAMHSAMKKSYLAILSSGLTTMLGFLALTLMRFEIGADLGIVLAKGIVFSLLAVMTLLPVLTIYTYKIIDKTHHKSFMPKFDKFSKFALKIGPAVIILVSIITIPSYKAQESNKFTYGVSCMESGEDTSLGKDIKKINDTFGKLNQLVLLIPSHTPAYEEEIADAIYDIEGVSSIISYSTSVGNEIPKSYIPKDQLSSLVSEDYSRLIITILADEESEVAFNAVESVTALGEKYFGDDYYLAGGSPSSYDIKETVISDNVVTTMGSIIAIGLVIMITYKSLSIPIILLVAIQSSIWINLAIPYFQNLNMAYIGFMIISSVQLGATVDYAILLANSYLDNRKIYNKNESIINTLKVSTGSVLTSSTILAISGIALATISTNSVIAQLGTLLGRGAILSAISVLFFLPSVLVLFDKVIEKTTIKAQFYKDKSKINKEDVKNEIEYNR